MATEPTNYQRLRGSGHREVLPWWGILLLFFVISFFALLLRGRRVRLWLGNDHLLLVESDGFREFYKRFRYEDIQALTVRKTIMGKTVMGVAAGIAGVFGLMGAATWAAEPAGAISLFILAAIFAAVAVSNLILGPTCEFHLRTAVQTEKLVALGRLRNALPALEALRSRIVAAQGELTVEELYAKSQEALFAAAEDPNAPPVIGRTAAYYPPAPEIKPPPQPYQSKVHFILFCLLVAALPVTVLNFVLPLSTFMTVVWWASFLATVGFVIIALIKQSNTDLPQTLKRITWSALAVQGLSLIIGLGYGIYLVMSNPGAIEDRTLHSDPVNIGMSVLFTGIAAVLGIMGFIHLRKFRTTVNIPPLTIPPPPN